MEITRRDFLRFSDAAGSAAALRRESQKRAISHGRSHCGDVCSHCFHRVPLPGAALSVVKRPLENRRSLLRQKQFKTFETFRVALASA